MKYVAEELEAISFDILQQFAPALLEGQGFECKEQIELNWACRQFAYHCTGIEIDLQSLTDSNRLDPRYPPRRRPPPSDDCPRRVQDHPRSRQSCFLPRLRGSWR